MQDQDEYDRRCVHAQHYDRSWEMCAPFLSRSERALCSDRFTDPWSSRWLSIDRLCCIKPKDSFSDFFLLLSSTRHTFRSTVLSTIDIPSTATFEVFFKMHFSRYLTGMAFASSVLTGLGQAAGPEILWWVSTVLET